MLDEAADALEQQAQLIEQARGALQRISGMVGGAFAGTIVAPQALDAVDDIARAVLKAMEG